MTLLHFFPCSCVKPGTRLKADDGFDCILPGKILRVEDHGSGLFVKCKEGKHYLDGQLSSDGTYYVGFSLADSPVNIVLSTTEESSE